MAQAMLFVLTLVVWSVIAAQAKSSLRGAAARNLSEQAPRHYVISVRPDITNQQCSRALELGARGIDSVCKKIPYVGGGKAVASLAAKKEVTLQSDECFINAVFGFSESDLKRSGFLIQNEVEGPAECQDLCRATPKCDSFMFSLGTHKCVLKAAEHVNAALGDQCNDDKVTFLKCGKMPSATGRLSYGHVSGPKDCSPAASFQPCHAMNHHERHLQQGCNCDCAAVDATVQSGHLRAAEEVQFDEVPVESPAEPREEGAEEKDQKGGKTVQSAPQDRNQGMLVGLALGVPAIAFALGGSGYAAYRAFTMKTDFDDDSPPEIQTIESEPEIIDVRDREVMKDFFEVGPHEMLSHQEMMDDFFGV